MQKINMYFKFFEAQFTWQFEHLLITQRAEISTLLRAIKYFNLGPAVIFDFIYLSALFLGQRIILKYVIYYSTAVMAKWIQDLTLVYDISILYYLSISWFYIAI